jgi:hypothetical protein
VKTTNHEFTIEPNADFTDEPSEDELRHLVAFMPEIYNEMVQIMSENEE